MSSSTSAFTVDGHAHVMLLLYGLLLFFSVVQFTYRRFFISLFDAIKRNINVKIHLQS